jgi:methionine-rich copper-binding protein CopC
MIVLAMLLSLVGVAGAHAYLLTSNPDNGSILEVAPDAIELSMSEAVEVRFSVFKVVPLPTNPDMTLRELVAAANALVEEVLPRRDDADLRVDTDLSAEGGTTTEITIALQEDLAPGTYLVMWKVLSIDTHTSQDFMVFTVREPTTDGE